jgi:IgA Peptidase M64
MATRFSAARRSALKRAGVAGLSLLLPGCEREATAPGPPPTAGDFTHGALRLDLRQRMSGGSAAFELARVRYEPAWPGPRTRLAQGPDWGDYRLSIYSAERDVPLFRQGFDTSVASGARAATERSSIRFPMPTRPVRATIEKRRGESAFQAIASLAIDPAAESVDRSAPAAPARVDTLLESGAPAARVDIAILGDGYRDGEHSKFTGDAARAAGYLFSVEPFKSRRRDFNVRAVFAPSAESGVTDPYLGLARNTALRCAYGSGAAERTLAAGDNRVLREIAAAAPYDFLLVLANTRRYGGSAFYGGPAVVAIDSAAAKYLVVHELAHAMAGLAEEYYLPAGDGPVYGGNIEPWQPNVTIAPERAKWKHLLPDPPRPTAWNKSEYDRRFAAYVRRYDKLREAGADEAAVERLMQQERARQAALLAKNGDPWRLGCYEGANGYARGMFRSGPDCIMFSLQSDFFCPACTAALTRAIDEECG